MVWSTSKKDHGFVVTHQHYGSNEMLPEMTEQRSIYGGSDEREVLDGGTISICILMLQTGAERTCQNVSRG